LPTGLFFGEPFDIILVVIRIDEQRDKDDGDNEQADQRARRHPHPFQYPHDFRLLGNKRAIKRRFSVHDLHLLHWQILR
jgi:hypothetical protein